MSIVITWAMFKWAGIPLAILGIFGAWRLIGFIHTVPIELAVAMLSKDNNRKIPFPWFWFACAVMFLTWITVMVGYAVWK